MNASFQDCTILNSLIKKNEGNWGKIFEEYSFSHVANGHAIADMAIENYIEMRDAVNDLNYQKRRRLELELERKFPERFIPRYSMVSFHQMPYSEVYAKGNLQYKLIDEVLKTDAAGTFIDKALVEKMLP